MEDKYFIYGSNYVHRQLSELTIIGLSDSSLKKVRAEKEPRIFKSQQEFWIYQAASKDELVGIDNLRGANNLEELVIPKDIRLIKKYACLRLPKLRKVVFEGKETMIEKKAFAECPNLVEVEMADEMLRYFPAFKGSPVQETLLDRYHHYANNLKVDDPDKSVDALHIVKYDKCPEEDDFGEAFSGCDRIQYVELRKNLYDDWWISRVRDLTMAFFNCRSLNAIVVPETVTNMISAFTGCDSLREIAVLGHYKKADAFSFTKAEKVKKLLLFNEEPTIIGSTPNAVWYVPEGSIDAYRQAVEEYNRTEGALVECYIYYKDIRPLQRAIEVECKEDVLEGLLSDEIWALLYEKGILVKNTNPFDIDFELIDAAVCGSGLRKLLHERQQKSL